MRFPTVCELSSGDDGLPESVTVRGMGGWVFLVIEESGGNFRKLEGDQGFASLNRVHR